LPSLESLRCFTEAARLLNFRAAARVVALTPAALGQRIRQLEDQVGEALFHRTSRKVVLTQAGLALLPRAQQVLSDAEACMRAAEAAAHTLIDTSAELPLFRYWMDAPEGGDRLRFAAMRQMGTIAAVRELVRAGEGVAVLPLYLVAPDLKDGRLVRILPSVKP